MIAIIMGFDFGTKKIGVAIGQKLTYTAQPLIVLRSQCGEPNWKGIEYIYHEWKPSKLIVGLPLHMNGQEQPITKLAKKFAIQLKKRFSVSVEMHDERFSSKEAKSNHFKYCHNIFNIKKNKDIDSIAAEVILRSWLNKNHKFIKS